MAVHVLELCFLSAIGDSQYYKRYSDITSLTLCDFVIFQEHQKLLASRGVAYVNVDVAVEGNVY